MGILAGIGNIYFVYQFLKKLVTPFNKTKAFELGIVDENGKILKRRRDLETKEEDFLQDSTAFELVGTSKGFDADTQFNTFLQEEFVVLYRQTSNSVRLDLQSTYGYNIFFEDEGKRNNIIINNGSTGGITTDGSSAVYSACKAGMIHVTKVWATELIGHGVRVNCITPGAITTPIFWGGAKTQSKEENEARRKRLDRWWIENRPAGRPGVPDDIAYAAVYLGSNESQHVSGHNLVLDAAHTATRMAFEELNAMKEARSKIIEGT